MNNGSYHTGLQCDLNEIIPMKAVDWYPAHGMRTRNTGYYNTGNKLCPNEGLLTLNTHSHSLRFDSPEPKQPWVYSQGGHQDCCFLLSPLSALVCCCSPGKTLCELDGLSMLISLGFFSQLGVHS